MSLTVLNVAYPLTRVGEDAVGGAEQIITELDAALTDAGHLSIVVACAGSAVRGVLLETPYPSGEISAPAVAQAQRRARELIESVQRAVRLDAIHFHGVDFWAYAPRDTETALIVTLHLQSSWYPPSALTAPPSNVHFVCMSEAQRAALPEAGASALVVQHGVDAKRFAPCGGKEDFFVALGRVCPEAGFHVALAAARRAKVRMRLVGAVFEYASHRLYFEEQIRPQLDEARQYIGPVAAEPRRRLLAQARGLLAPSAAPEASTLVAMQALACGTPVIAMRQGALAEVVEHGRDGFLVSSEDEMVEAIANIDRIDPAACRAAALRRCSAPRMVQQYLELYERVATRPRRE